MNKEYFSTYLGLLLIFFSIVLCFSLYNSLVKFIPRYFVLLDAVINGIAILIFFSDFSFLI